MTAQQSEPDSFESVTAPGTQFSIGALMVATLALGCWFGMMRVVPHIGGSLLSLFLAGLSSRFTSYRDVNYDWHGG